VFVALCRASWRVLIFSVFLIYHLAVASLCLCGLLHLLYCCYILVEVLYWVMGLLARRVDYPYGTVHSLPTVPYSTVPRERAILFFEARFNVINQSCVSLGDISPFVLSLSCRIEFTFQNGRFAQKTQQKQHQSFHS